MSKPHPPWSNLRPEPAKALIVFSGLTIRSAAEAIGIKSGHLHNAIAGRSRLSEDASQRLADLLDVDVEDLWTNEGDTLVAAREFAATLRRRGQVSPSASDFAALRAATDALAAS